MTAKTNNDDEKGQQKYSFASLGVIPILFMPAYALVASFPIKKVSNGGWEVLCDFCAHDNYSRRQS